MGHPSNQRGQMAHLSNWMTFRLEVALPGVDGHREGRVRGRAPQLAGVEPDGVEVLRLLAGAVGVGVGQHVRSVHPLHHPDPPARVPRQPGVADRVVQLLQRQKRVVKIDTLLFHDEALKALKAQVAALKEEGKPEDAKIDVATFKARFDVSRKFAIPLLEYLDRERVTRRVGDARVIL